MAFVVKHLGRIKSVGDFSGRGKNHRSRETPESGGYLNPANDALKVESHSTSDFSGKYGTYMPSTMGSTDLCEIDDDSNRQELQTGVDIRNVIDDGKDDFEIGPFKDRVKLSAQARGRLPVKSFADQALELGSIENFHSASPEKPLTDLSLANSSLSPLTENISQQTTIIGRLPKIATHIPNPRPDTYIQPCSLPSHYIDHQIVLRFEVLREQVNALFQEWMKQWILHYCADVRFPSSAPFEKGIECLQVFYLGTIPRTFEDTFALMHIVYACARIYHKQDEPQSWRILFLNVLQWQYVIATQDDLMLFVKVALMLWAVPEYPEAEAAAEAAVSSIDCLPQLCCSLQEIHVNQGSASSLCFNDPQTSTPQAFGPLMTPSFMSPIDLLLRDMLREGPAIGLCRRFLDDFAYAKICARNVVETTQRSLNLGAPLETTQNMQTHIIEKLQQWDSTDDFRTPIIEAQSDLHRGWLLNPREVEVKLVADGQFSNRSQSVYDEYRNLVYSLCNDAMSSSSSSWRDRYYATDLDEVLSIFYETVKRPASGNSLTGEENQSDTIFGLNDLLNESPISASSGQSDSPTDFSFPTLTCSPCIGSLESSGDNSNTTIARNSTSSSSSVEFSSPTSKTILYCPICKMAFHAKKDHDQRTNLKRHIATHAPNRMSCPCPISGCGKAYLRSDNLRRHCRNDHKVVLDQSTGSPAKRNKISGI